MDLSVHGPTLVLWGERDHALTIYNLDGLDAFVPALKIKRFPDASHWIVHEKPNEVKLAIREFVGTNS
jgi:pimeloyl-ACP methyl ester carboxylesterase